MIAEAIDHPIDMPSKERPPFGPLRLAPLLDAQAEIAAARGDRDTLQRAAGELRSIAALYPSNVLRANALLAEGRLCIIEGEPDRAVTLASHAVAEHTALGGPFDAAMARLVVAAAYESGGHREQAAFERRLARDALAAFGAEVWAERCDVPTVEPDRSPPAPSGAPVAPHAVFRSAGDTRTVGWGDSSVVMRDLKGFRYLARLVAEPAREFHAVDLVRLESGADVERVTDAGVPMLDESAKAAYRRRLADIDEDIEDALTANDLGRVELAERDREYLVAELQRAVGLGGRDRKVLDDAERARVSVTRSIRYSLDRLAEFAPDVAAHLHQHVHTGTFCSYEPDSLHPVDWVL